MGMLLIIASTFIQQLEGIFIKKYNSRHRSGGFLFTALISLFAMVFFIITNTNGFFAPTGIILYGIAAGILFCTASFLTYIALSCGSYALSMLFLSYSLVFTIGYGLFFLKEEASLLTYSGLIAMLISMYFTRGQKDTSKNQVTAKWLICIVLSCVSSGFFGILQRAQQISYNDRFTNEFMIIAMAVSALILFTAGIIKDRKNIKEIVLCGSLYAIAAGLSNGACNMLWMFINTIVPISFSSPVSAGVKNIVSFLISVLIFKEKLLKRQIFGLALGTVALLVLNI